MLHPKLPMVIFFCFGPSSGVKSRDDIFIEIKKIKKKKSHQVRIGLGWLVTSTQEGLSRYP